MQDLVNLVPLLPETWFYLGIDICIAICLLYALRLMSGKMASVSTTEELGSQDNIAFGISVAGRMLALCLVLSAAAASSDTNGFEEAAMSMLLYGLVGILLIKIGRILNDKIILNRINKEAMIKDRNTSVAIVDAASSVSTALIVSNVMLWVIGTDLNALFAVISGFIVTQAILLLRTRIYERRFLALSQSNTFQQTIAKGQLAVAVQHSGNLLATAIVVSASSSLLIYTPQGYVSNLTGWLIVGMGLTLMLLVLVIVAKKIILAGLNLAQEVEQQHNVGVASIEMVLSVGLALIVSGLFT
ncbi:DUF350 domain-containing protein [Aliiglaciecola sp. 3_MG-2023]|uniref:DUF350 domain-containing protein n=1 Tax=Aliiglaciecola sp. 3_MG-2023 TaxID=3062644 RepID=UPI0026E31F3C|nr:DUF350 domain-containing protein [Aliiglaciecola sp. 3_MG-2023]MDO6691895.1 DUF350 domain-containing protein [Aliiglaciecola sp. 3_MG-2023]